MNILYLAHRIPYPPDKGDKMRSFRELEHLAKHHRVWCACFVDDAADLTHVEALRAHCEDVIAIRLRKPSSLMRGLLGFARGRTVTESFYEHPAMHRAVRRWCIGVDFDAIVAFSSSMAPYALRVTAGRRILDLCDVDSQKWLDYATRSTGPARWLYGEEGKRLAAKERDWIDRFDATLLISSAEAAAIRGPVAIKKIHVVSNGVVLPPSPDRGPSKSIASPPTVGFVGVMNYRPNVDGVCWFVSRCWPDILATHPSAQFRIVGRSPTRRARQLGRVRGVTVVGAVKDVFTELSRFDVSVAPLRIARGLQNKVLEAMASARPVVLTPEAAEGIEAQSGRDFVVADGRNALVDAVCGLLDDAGARLRIGLAGRQFVASRHAWDRQMAKLDLIVGGADRPVDLPMHAVGATSSTSAHDSSWAGTTHS